ncbi:elongation factor P maturation arginine rhamnosyltransferase EarP [Pseudomonas sp. RIT-PI-AD]|uniref:elongation factor P maturation arginine rhamnosyltransferase EarP n=1 Tax=Pseudomonas sp. RIT-PI-AD TaxID=3035294 RepID=UPI0021D9A5AE|nr:elongation factor P maturation arginine rhamnosyltransferase EarP [Pseudomonas sp. RIT-PI-AD]
MSVSIASARWDIFCRVIDNYGDIGVTWRLARQLAREHGFHVRLWLDEPAAFVRLCPQADGATPGQWIDGVEVRQWPTEWQAEEPADVVIEAFACELPQAYRRAMAERRPTPRWINLEYLSAESWVAGCHGLPSPQENGLPKFFFFPGFSAATGGLLREDGLLERRRAFQADPLARDAFLGALGVEPRPGERLVSLFAYENPALPGWLEALSSGTTSTRLLVPEGRILADVARWLGERPKPGDVHSRGALSLHVLPFLAQDDYDRLLWSCDFNGVRGEDSFLRAQWAGRPLLWHIYPQEDGAHWDKLDAFLELYGAELPPAVLSAFESFWRGWNAGTDVTEAWIGLEPHLALLRLHAERWCQAQGERADLASALVAFLDTSAAP